MCITARGVVCFINPRDHAEVEGSACWDGAQSLQAFLFLQFYIGLVWRMSNHRRIECQRRGALGSRLVVVGRVEGGEACKVNSKSCWRWELSWQQNCCAAAFKGFLRWTCLVWGFHLFVLICDKHCITLHIASFHHHGSSTNLITTDIAWRDSHWHAELTSLASAGGWNWSANTHRQSQALAGDWRKAIAVVVSSLAGWCGAAPSRCYIMECV